MSVEIGTERSTPVPSLPFSDVRELSRDLVVAPWLLAILSGGVVAGAIVGASRDEAPPQRLLRATFLGSAAGYLGVSLLDFWEHFRLEKEISGRYWGFQAVPVGESVNHVATVSLVLVLLGAARPLRGRLSIRDWLTLAAPGPFLLLGWRDEMVFHRRRARHREDLMHTVAHLAAGVMLATNFALQLVDWKRVG